MRKLVLLAVNVCFALLLAGSAMAAPTWVTCAPLEVGTEAGVGATDGYYVNLRNVATGQEKWFMMNPAKANEFLATLLTAQSLGSNISAFADFDYAGPGYYTINGIYMKTVTVAP